jgi:hypothetical protein
LIGLKLVMPGLVPGIHDFLGGRRKDVDGRGEPGHDAENLTAAFA